MPRYFIDTDDGDIRIRDSIGHSLPDAEAARLAALDILPEMAREKMPDGDRHQFGVFVRLEDGTVSYEATLFLRGRWTIEDPDAQGILIEEALRLEASDIEVHMGRTPDTPAIGKIADALIDVKQLTMALTDPKIDNLVTITLLYIARVLSKEL